MVESTCRSVSPKPSDILAGLPCEKPRGHKRRWHSNPSANRRWEGGINTPARWEPPPDDGYRTEGELHAMYVSGVRW